MTTRIERQDWNNVGGTEGPTSFKLNPGNRASNLGGWGREEFIIDASVRSATDETTEVELLFRPGRLNSPQVTRANGEVEWIQRPEMVDRRIDPSATIILHPGDELFYRAPNVGTPRNYEVKVTQE